MTEFLREYLRWGFSGIYVLRRHERRDDSGHANECIHEIIVARKGRKFTQVELYEKKDCKSTEISKELYKQLIKDKRRSDNKEARGEVKDRQEHERKNTAPDKKIRQLVFSCPECKGGELEPRRGRYGPFWGCRRFPDCSYTRKMGEKEIKLYAPQLAGNV